MPQMGHFFIPAPQTHTNKILLYIQKYLTREQLFNYVINLQKQIVSPIFISLNTTLFMHNTY
jgi:hypothetical protein